MFRTAELGREVPKREYKEAELQLRQELLQLQHEMLEQGRFQMLIDFAGVDGAGKGASVNLLYKWMDPRWLMTTAFDKPTEAERERPYFWRYWIALPPRGQIGLHLSGRYSQPLLNRVFGRIDSAGLDRALDHINTFESMLADDNALILKFWMHLSREAQEQRLKSLEKDPLSSWRVTKTDWKHWKMYPDFIAAAERIITRTSTGNAPWHIVEGYDVNYRSLTVGRLIRDAIRDHLARVQERDRLAASRQETVPEVRTEEHDRAAAGPVVTVFSRLDMSRSLKKATYRKNLLKYQGELHLLQRKLFAKGISTVMVMEGPDAAGKGGVIRRVISPLDARNYRVFPFAAPTDEEAAQHYLWRFWRHLPRDGRLAIFDRSWYGRVLVERVEGFASEVEWQRAYAEINDFEERLVGHGSLLVKYWVHISKEEQLARFEAREQTPHKRWKLTEEDWRNREKWDSYEVAAHDLVERTSTGQSPWILVPGNDKLYARIEVLRTLCQQCKRVLAQD